MLTTPASTSKSPISSVPYDVLQEVFMRCLPPYPFDNLDFSQPDVGVAPMLLCQICSFWRTVALTSAPLWSHLSYQLKIIEPNPASFHFLADQIAFLSWWRKNDGSIASFFCIDVDLQYMYTTPPGCQVVQWDAPECVSVLKYLTSAQYIQADDQYWDLFRRLKGLGHHFRHPNLRTLAKRGDRWKSPNLLLEGQQHLELHSTLHRLSLNDDKFPRELVIPVQWSELTHLSLTNICLSLEIWFLLVRSLPVLQRAFFDIKRLSGTPSSYTEPTEYTFVHLSECCVQYSDDYRKYNDFPAPLGLLFKNLHFPALRALTLSSCHDSWYSVFGGLTELYTVLKSTPFISEITLSKPFLGMGAWAYLPGLLDVGVAGRSDLQIPIWILVPNLTHLCLDLPDTSYYVEAVDERLNELETYIEHALFTDNFLGLNDAACPIQEITLIDPNSVTERFERIKEVVFSSILKHTNKESSIKLNASIRIVPDSAKYSMASMWREWGSNI